MARGKRYAKHSERLGRDVDWLRGRHKKSDSAEVHYWNEEHLIPRKPDWMDGETYTKLASLRKAL